MKKLILAVSAFLTVSTSAFAQLGSTDKDLVYTPVTPCRVLDTRTSQGGTGAIAANGTKDFKIWGQTSFSAQGGSTGNCGLTAGSNIAAVAMNFTVVTPAAGGFITAHPFGVARPTAATVNFQVGDIARGDFSIAKVTQTGTAATNHLSIYSTSLADVVGDVVGYYSPPVSAGSLACETVQSDLDVPANYNSFLFASGAGVCSTGYSAVSSRCYSTNLNIILTGSGINTSGQAFCFWRNTSASAITVNQGTTCCRIPGR